MFFIGFEKNISKVINQIGTNQIWCYEPIDAIKRRKLY